MDVTEVVAKISAVSRKLELHTQPSYGLQRLHINNIFNNYIKLLISHLIHSVTAAA